MTFRPRHISEEDFKVFENRVSGGMIGKSSCQSGQARASISSLDKTKVQHAAPSPYKSKWEAAYANKLELEKRAGLIKAYYYEPFSLWLPGKIRYKPDFLVDNSVHALRDLELVEVKGWSKNRRDGMTRLKIAASLFPCFVWRLVYRTDGGGWSGEYI